MELDRMHEQDDEPVEWTPLGGMIRGTIVGLIAAAILGALLIPLAAYAHGVLLSLIVRAFIAFLVAWIIYGVIERAAGMTGWFTTILTCLLALSVMLSNHLVWAYTGLPFGPDHEIMKGLKWMFRPEFLFYNNIGTYVGVGVCAVLCRDGQPGPDYLGQIASTRYWG